MPGAFTNTVQTRADSENALSGTYIGSYGVCQKLNQAITGYTPGTPATVSIDPVTVANLQGYYFAVDQGTATYPLVLTITSDTAKTISINLVAGQAVQWDVSQKGTPGSGTTAAPYGIFSGSISATTLTAFGNIASATLTIPVGLAYTGTVNFVGRIYST